MVTSSATDPMLFARHVEEPSTASEADRILEFIRGWYAREAEGADKAIGKSWKKFQREDIFWA
jgi:hypothetical protein